MWFALTSRLRPSPCFFHNERCLPVMSNAQRSGSVSAEAEHRPSVPGKPNDVEAVLWYKIWVPLHRTVEKYKAITRDACKGSERPPQRRFPTRSPHCPDSFQSRSIAIGKRPPSTSLARTLTGPSQTLSEMGLSSAGLAPLTKDR